MSKVMVYSEQNSVFIFFLHFIPIVYVHAHKRVICEIVEREMLEKTWSVLDEVVFSGRDLW